MAAILLMYNVKNDSSKICLKSFMKIWCFFTSSGINRYPEKQLAIDTMSANIKEMEYAVRGPIHLRANAVGEELRKGEKKRFKEVIRAHLGDCQAMGQMPITFMRQLAATVSYTELLNSPKIPSDVKERAKIILADCGGGSVGSYSDSPGINVIRKHIAEFIKKRDGYPANFENIYLTTGVSDGIKNILKLFAYDVKCKKAGIMIPVPQYPLYPAVITELGMTAIPYNLAESKFWGLDMEDLNKQIKTAKIYTHPRAIVVINPGNPTGQVLTKENLIDIVKFAYKERLVIFADEVYQDNIYGEGSQFHSMKKILMELGDPYDKMECLSFLSASKGYTGECGLRSGYVEVINMDPQVKAMYLKILGTFLCAPTIGQTVMDAIANPPTKGEPSYELFIKEKAGVLQALKTKAKMMVDAFNSFEGFKCNPVQGAMYAFPRITLPPGALKAAEKAGQLPDLFYCFELLNNTGIVTVPGSGFGQEEGTYHFRTTILPPTELLKKMLEIFREFHKEFVNKYK